MGVCSGCGSSMRNSLEDLNVFVGDLDDGRFGDS